jgi:formylglycine-generating enzyme required for sulfatase activity
VTDAAAGVPVAEPETVVVNAGDAVLGDPPRTEHVNVYAIARRPVSAAEYRRFRPQHPQPDDDAPLLGVTWADAVGYCRWLSTSTGRVYRLPDEREWEKAARGGLLEEIGRLEWTNSYGEGRVLRGHEDVAARRYVTDDLREVGFRVVRSMTGR